MTYALKMVEVLKTLTGVDSSEIALFVADVYRMFKASGDDRYHRLLDQIYAMIRKSPVAPAEFIDAFKHVAGSPYRMTIHLKPILFI